MRPWLLLAAVNGALGVVFAAWAAHGLGSEVRPAVLVERGAQFQLLHALALLAVDRLVAEGMRPARVVGLLFLAGIVLFSGSLYVKALAGPLLPGQLTPAGGICFILGWLALAVVALRGRRR